MRRKYDPVLGWQHLEDSGLVKMAKLNAQNELEVIEVHPTTVAAHEAAGWSKDSVLGLPFWEWSNSASEPEEQQPAPTPKKSVSRRPKAGATKRRNLEAWKLKAIEKVDTMPVDRTLTKDRLAELTGIDRGTVDDYIGPKGLDPAFWTHLQTRLESRRSQKNHTITTKAT